LIDYSKTIGRALERLNLSVGEREAWEVVKRYIEEYDQERRRRVETNATSSNDTQELRKEVSNLADVVKKLVEGSKQQTWAQIARPTQLAPPLPARSAREVLVSRDQAANTESTKTVAEIVAEVRSVPGGKGEIVGTRKLPSGDVALTFKSAEAKEYWKDQGALASIFGPGATIKERTLDVIVFGFPAKAISGLSPE